MKNKQRRQQMAGYKKQPKPKYKTQEIRQIEDLVLERIGPTNTFGRWWENLSSAEKAVWISFGISSIAFILYVYAQNQSMDRNDFSGRMVPSIPNGKENILPAVIPTSSKILFPTLKSEASKEGGGALPLKNSKQAQRFFKAPEKRILDMAQLPDISFIPDSNHFKKPITLELLTSKVILRPIPGQVIDAETKDRIESQALDLIYMIDDLIRTDKGFSDEFSFVFHHPDFKIAVSDTLNNRAPSGFFSNNHLVFNLNRLENIDFIRTVRHEVHHAKMAFMNHAYQPISIETGQLNSIPYNLFISEDPILKQEFQHALKEDMNILLTNLPILIAKERAGEVLSGEMKKDYQLTKAILEKYYIPKLSYIYMPIEMFLKEQSKVDERIAKEDYPYMGHSTVPKESWIYVRNYYFYKSDDGKEFVALAGTRFSDLDKFLLEAFLIDIAGIEENIINQDIYSKMPPCEQDAERDAMISEYGVEMMQLLFPRLTAFHKKKFQIFEDTMEQLRRNRDTFISTETNSNSDSVQRDASSLRK